MFCLNSRRWFVLCLACIPHLGAGTGVRRQGISLSFGPNWVGVTWRRRQNPVSETLCFDKINRTLFLNKDRTMGNVQQHNICIQEIFRYIWKEKEPGQINRCSDGLEDRGSNPGRGKFYLFSTASEPVLRSTQPPMQWIPVGSFHGSKAAGSWSWPLTTIYCRGKKMVELCLHSPICLRGVVFN
jgi:hypothetical protein